MFQLYTFMKIRNGQKKYSLCKKGERCSSSGASRLVSRQQWPKRPASISLVIAFCHASRSGMLVVTAVPTLIASLTLRYKRSTALVCVPAGSRPAAQLLISLEKNKWQLFAQKSPKLRNSVWGFSGYQRIAQRWAFLRYTGHSLRYRERQPQGRFVSSFIAAGCV